jgi:hypothetical protein
MLLALSFVVGVSFVAVGCPKAQQMWTAYCMQVESGVRYQGKGVLWSDTMDMLAMDMNCSFD